MRKHVLILLGIIILIGIAVVTWLAWPEGTDLINRGLIATV